MFMASNIAKVLVAIALVGVPALVYSEDANQADRDTRYRKYLDFSSHVKGGRVEPHWMAGGNSFWYIEGGTENTVIWKVDPLASSRESFFETARLRLAMAELTGRQPPHTGLPFREFAFVDDTEKVVAFEVGGHEFLLDLRTYALRLRPPKKKDKRNWAAPKRIPQHWHGWYAREVVSPDGAWFVGIEDYNVYIRSTRDNRRTRLTVDGVKDYEWDVATAELIRMVRPGPGAIWSPDSSKLAVRKIDYREVPQIPIVNYLKTNEDVRWVHYSKAGQPIAQTELYVIDITSKDRVRIDTGKKDQLLHMLGWRSDGSELLYLQFDGFYRSVELVAANPTTRSRHVILSERHETTFNPGLPPRLYTPVDDGSKFIWMSQDGELQHLFLYDKDGTLIRKLTNGPISVQQVVGIDEETGHIYFMALSDGERPFDPHLYRVDMMGSGLEKLTSGKGRHYVQMSSSKKFFVDTYSSVGHPPHSELKRVNGELVMQLADADISALHELGWKPPEKFVVTGADGMTELSGVLYKPVDFDSTKRYPVIEMLGRPQLEFDGGTWARAMAELGFVVFTSGPKRPWGNQNYGDHSSQDVPNRVAVLQQLAKTRGYMDLDRVGILGQSYFGHFAVRAMLEAPKHYHVGIAVAPVIDVSEHAGNVLLLGPPEENKEGYERAANTRLAGKLEGNLLLVHGTHDEAVPFSHTMKMVDALIRADKPFDLVVVPEWGHWGNERLEQYWMNRCREYFEEHLTAE